MVKLFIDYTEVVLEREQSFSITKINPFVSKDNSYSYDITLSLNNPINAKLFKSINRKDVSINSKNYHASLFVNGRTVLEGTAVVVDVSQNSVTIQLLQGKKECLSDIADRYIDNIHIGYWYDFDFLLFKYYDRFNGGFYPQKIDEDDFVLDAHIQDTFCQQCAIDTSKYSVLDESDSDPFFVEYDYYDVVDILETRCKYDMYKKDIIYFCPIEIQGQKENDTLIIANNYSYDNGKWTRPKINLMAPQLRLWYVVEKIFSKLGYTIVENLLKTDDFFKSIIIANANTTHHLCKTLPHWTIKQFIDNIENFCCCIFEFNGNLISIKKKANFFSTSKSLNVINRYSKSVNVDINDNDNSIKNYSYDLQVCDYNIYDVIDKNILSQCVFINCNSIEDRNNKYNSNKGSNVIFIVNNIWYFMRNGKWHIINYFRDFVNNDSVETIKLAINPAAVYQSTINEIDLFFLCAEGIRFSDSSSFHINQSFSIVDAVENENDNSLKGLDKMYVAFFNGKNGDNSFAFPLVSVGDDIYGIVKYDVGYNFRLS